MGSWVVPVDSEYRNKEAYNVCELRSFNVLDGALIGEVQDEYALVAFPNRDHYIVLYSGLKEKCDALLDKLLEDIHNDVKVICIINHVIDINRRSV